MGTRTDRRERIVTVEDEARAEAWRVLPAPRIVDDLTGEDVALDDYGYAETERAGFVKGAVWQSGCPVVITNEMVDEAARVWTCASPHVWADTVESGGPLVGYWRYQARAALEAALSQKEEA